VLGRYRAKFSRDGSSPYQCRAWRISHCVRRARRRRPHLPPSARAKRYDRVAHAYGKSYPDYVRAMLGDYDSAPDVVAYHATKRKFPL